MGMYMFYDSSGKFSSSISYLLLFIEGWTRNGETVASLRDFGPDTVSQPNLFQRIVVGINVVGGHLATLWPLEEGQDNILITNSVD